MQKERTVAPAVDLASNKEAKDTEAKDAYGV